jgi:hypothetical protein
MDRIDGKDWINLVENTDQWIVLFLEYRVVHLKDRLLTASAFLASTLLYGVLSRAI